ncbi:MAG: recombination mediator RecR [Armatimonadetes bacterium]|nr:recombination mediator RecR [Armatimonadota bacterium]
MAYFPEPVRRLFEELERLPGIGPKSAQRLALYLLQAPEEDVDRLAEALVGAKRLVRRCSACFNWATAELCEICADPYRDKTVICVVEQPIDVAAVERSGEYRGLYHVLEGALNPVLGVGPENLRLAELLQRVRDLQPAEVILATSPTVEGDATAEYIRGELERGGGVKVTRIALGLPVGADLDYADQVTLARALRGRRPME